jgi:cytochrome c oxidase assembly protein subunit 20
MAPNETESERQVGPKDKVLHLWSTPLPESQTNADGTPNPDAPPVQHTLREALDSIKKDDWARITETPCAREGLLTGIGSGFAVGMLRFLVKGTLSKAAS